ncbi:MAG: OmpA family protein [Bacteroidales bacterium]|nr:OmpA family protein [Bacteroidales bacterium]
MKGIKTILGALAVASLFTFSFSASAQENGNRDENGNVVRGSYETNKFWDNWFIGAGAGVNATMGSNVKFNLGGLAVDVNAGKWFTPTLGLRVGYRGIKNAVEPKTGYVTAIQDGEFNQHYFHADVLWNMLESIDGYKETRFYNLIPYAQFGVLNLTGNTSDEEFGSGVGLLNTFRLGERLDLFVDVNAVIAREAIYKINDTKKYAGLLSATAGLIFNLGRTNFDRHSSVTPVVVPLPFTLDQYNALQDRVNALEAENAALKNEIAELKAKTPDVVYKDVQVASPATLYFDSNSSKLSVREKAHLDYYIENILAKTENKVTVYGHADKKTGTEAVNNRIAGKRAETVKNYLVSKGIDESRIEVVNEGANNNLFDTPFQLNRCVVIK